MSGTNDGNNNLDAAQKNQRRAVDDPYTAGRLKTSEKKHLKIIDHNIEPK